MSAPRFLDAARRRFTQDPLLVLTAILSGLAGGSLGLTGEVTLVALAMPVLAAFALARPATAPRGLLFEAAFQVIALVALAYFVLSLGQGRILGGAVALTLPVQAHALLSAPTQRFLRRLQVLSFFQLLALASTTTQLIFAPVLVVHLLLSPLVLTLAALERATLEKGGTQPRRPVPWSSGFLKPAFGASASCLAIGIVVFLVLPRYEMGLLQALAQPGQRISGFSDSVTLGDITSIQTSDKIVLRARLSGDVPADLRWRGKTFDSFNGRAWSVSNELRNSREVKRDGSAAIVGSSLRPPSAPSESPAARAQKRVVQDLTVEPLRVRALFVLDGARPLRVEPETFQGVLVDTWGNLARGGEGVRRLRYRVESEIGPDPRELTDTERDAFLALPILDERIPELAKSLAGEGDALTKARRIEQALQRDWTYSLDVSDRDVKDPVARFLIEKSSGHCEYFATGMIILLRSEGIPARLITGFQQGEWSRLFRNHVVRQRDAHAWVEAFIPGNGWTTFDPTPFAGRVAGGGPTLELWDRIEMLWDDNVIGFNYTFQLSFLITVRDLALDAVHSLSRRPLLVLGILLALIGVPAILLALRSRRLRLSSPPRREIERSVFYRKALRLLARKGYRRAPGQTPLELASRAAREGGPPGQAALALTRLYYAARFGDAEPDAARVDSLLAELERLEPRRR